MRVPRSGRLVRSSDSVHPVQSWKCSQMMDGRRAPRIPVATSAALALSVNASPKGAATISCVHSWRNERREAPARASA
jgi:N-dimethylarginine dimethylaminohydrolase